MAQRTITWLLYHEPIDLFLRTAKAFSKEIFNLTDGRLAVEVYTLKEYADKFKNGAQFDPLTLIQNGEVQMSQLQVGKLGEWHATDFYALDLPFLFKTHDHATRVLDGDIGFEMLAGLEKTTPVRGMAFTYSGGYRVFAADRPIETVEDFKNLSMATKTNPVFIDTAEAFGCDTTSLIYDELIEDRDDYNAVQTTLPRYYNEANTDIHSYVTNTKHSMYLTSIVISKNFWQSLPQEDQTAIQQAALNSARLERTWTIEDAEKIANDTVEQQRLGIADYREFPANEADKLKDRVKPVYTKYEQIFTPGLVNRILNA